MCLEDNFHLVGSQRTANFQANFRQSPNMDSPSSMDLSGELIINQMIWVQGGI